MESRESHHSPDTPESASPVRVTIQQEISECRARDMKLFESVVSHREIHENGHTTYFNKMYPGHEGSVTQVTINGKTEYIARVKGRVIDCEANHELAVCERLKALWLQDEDAKPAKPAEQA